MRSLKILFVEDDKYFREAIRPKLLEYGEVLEAESASEATSYLKQDKIDVAFIDLDLGEKLDGLKVIKAVAQMDIYPIVLTGYGQQAGIAKAYELGCQHFVSKREFQSDVARLVGPYLTSLRSNGIQEFMRRELITQDGCLISLLESLPHMNFNGSQRILIRGEKGTGKSRLAGLVHELAGSDTAPFVKWRAKDFLESNMEGVLLGQIEEAKGGTLLIEEVSELSLPNQRILYNVLSDLPSNTDVDYSQRLRVICSTSQPLELLVEEKRFRLDLFLALKGIELKIPALKERRKDIPLLLDFFIRESEKKILITDAAMKDLNAYDWFGNVAELKTLVADLCSRPIGVVNITDLPNHIRRNKNPYRPIEGQKVYSKTMSAFIQKHGLRKLFEVLEQEAFKEFSDRSNGNLSKTQEALKISKSAAYRIQESIRTSPKV